MKVSEQYFEGIEAAARNVVIKMNKETTDYEKFGLTKSQFAMLALIAKEEFYKITSLAAIMEVNPSAITSMIDRLVSNNFVSRRHDEIDRRAVLVSITEEGQKVLNAINEKRCQVMKRYLLHLDENELEVLLRILGKFEKIDK